MDLRSKARAVQHLSADQASVNYLIKPWAGEQLIQADKEGKLQLRSSGPQKAESLGTGLPILLEPGWHRYEAKRVKPNHLSPKIQLWEATGSQPLGGFHKYVGNCWALAFSDFL